MTTEYFPARVLKSLKSRVSALEDDGGGGGSFAISAPVGTDGNMVPVAIGDIASTADIDTHSYQAHDPLKAAFIVAEVLMAPAGDDPDVGQGALRVGLYAAAPLASFGDLQFLPDVTISGAIGNESNSSSAQCVFFLPAGGRFVPIIAAGTAGTSNYVSYAIG